MFSNSNNSFSQLHNRQKGPMYTGDSAQWPKSIQAIQVALMGLRIQVDPKKPESILPLQAMTYFRKCPVNSIPQEHYILECVKKFDLEKIGRAHV